MSKKTVWDLNPQMKKCFQTTDGEKFFTADNAKTHARSLDDRSVTELKRPKAAKPKVVKATPVDELTPMQKAAIRVKAISKLTTVEAVKAALKGETAKSVKAAGNDRIKSIKAAASDSKKEEEE